MLLLACGILTLAVMGCLGWPLWRNLTAPAAARSAYDLKVYRAQLDDLDRDLDRGVIEADEAHLLRLEIERRILKIDPSGDASTTSQPKRHRAALAGVILVLGLLPVGLYTLLGSPRLPDQPFAARAGQIAKTQEQAAKIQAMVEQLAAKLQKNPNDGDGWLMLGRSLRVLRQPEQALTALGNAIKLLPDNIQARLEYGAVMLDTLAPGSQLPEAFVAVMRDILAINPDVPEALYFVGLAESEAGHNDQTRALWTKLLTKIPVESPDHAELQKQLDALK